MKQPGFIKDILLTMMSAVFTGFAASLLLILLVFGWTNVQAEPPREGGQLKLRSLDGASIEEAPLLGTDVNVTINGLLARVRVEQRFSNLSDHWMEGVYQFPLPPEAAVDQLNMWIGERVIEGRIAEKAAAKREYQKAKQSGRKASLLSQQRPNMFTTSVANIAPGEEIRIEIEFSQTILFEEGRYQWRFPMVIGPRYIPGQPLLMQRDQQTGWALPTDQVPDAHEITPPVLDPAFGKQNPVSMQISLDAGLPVTELISQYHRVTSRQVGRRVEIQLADGEVPADRDFLLSWRVPVGLYPKTAIFQERWQDEDYALLMVMPPDLEVESQRLPREMIFVIDSSGSMHGASMQQAKAALRLALSRLGDQDSFNLIHFSDQSHALFSRPLAGNERNRYRAIRFVDRLEAEGGTEMMPALRMALGSSEDKERLRQIVFLTDGSVGNESALFELIQQRLGQSRLFTIGIGSAPNSHFMQRAADFGRGSFTYIGDLGEVESRMRNLFEKLEHPAMRDIHLEWQAESPMEILPSRIPDLYLGEPLMLALKSDELTGELMIEGDRDGTPWRQTINLISKPSHDGLHKYWAKQKIQGLMSAATDEITAETKRERVLELALNHQLVSAYTSLIAVEKQPSRPPESLLKGGQVPLNLPAGWDANHVFGSLPQTATPATLWLLLGIFLLLSAYWMRQRECR
jgi:Ca-activated chloride channel family protein